MGILLRLLPPNAGLFYWLTFAATFHKLMTIALLENRVDFVEYILDQELLDIHAYLNISALCRLYNDIDDHTHLFALLKYYGIRRVDKKKGVAMIGLVSAVNKLAVVQKNEGGIAEDMLDAWKSKPDQKDDAPFVDLPMVHKLLVRMVGSFENPLYFTSRVSNLIYGMEIWKFAAFLALEKLKFQH